MAIETSHRISTGDGSRRRQRRRLGEGVKTKGKLERGRGQGKRLSVDANQRDLRKKKLSSQSNFALSRERQFG